MQMRQVILLGGIKGSSTRTVVVTIAKHELRSTCLVGEYQDMPTTYVTLRMSLAMCLLYVLYVVEKNYMLLRVYNDIYLMLYVLLIIELYNSESIFPAMAQL